MLLFKQSNALNRHVLEKKSRGLSVGWVPTMGALHQGHFSLVHAAHADNQLIICSIFVNPTQFNDKNDFSKYPVTLEKDIYLLEECGVDILFLPAAEEVYPEGTDKLEIYDLGQLGHIFEGKYRPGHFQGVCQVICRLMNIIAPDHLYMGQKDYQQCMVIQRLLELVKSPTILHTCPTERESDGLAMSSRNIRLNETERKNAIGIYKALTYLKENLKKGSLAGLIDRANGILAKYDFRADYVAIAHAKTLEPIAIWDGALALVGLIAAYQHEVRLIDNLLLTDAGD